MTLPQSRRECRHRSSKGSINRVGSSLRVGLLVVGRNVHERRPEGGRLGLQALERGQDDGGYAQGLEVGLAVGQGGQGGLDVRGQGARDIGDDGLRVRARGLGLVRGCGVGVVDLSLLFLSALVLCEGGEVRAGWSSSQGGDSRRQRWRRIGCPERRGGIRPR